MMIKRLTMKRLGRNLLKIRILMELEEVQKNKSRATWKNSLRGRVCEDTEFWNIWRKNVSVF